MKKILKMGLLLSLVMVALMACEKEEEKKMVDLNKKGHEIIRDIQEMASTEDLLSFYTSDPTILDLAKNFSNQDFDQPRAVFQISMDTSKIMDSFFENSPELPENISKHLDLEVLPALGVQINGESGASNVVLSNILTSGSLFINQGQKDNYIYLYLYDSPYSMFTTFSVHEDDIVSARCTPLFNGEFEALKTSFDVEAWFKDKYKLDEVTVVALYF